MTPEQEKMLIETRDAVKSVLQVLKGFNGDKGLCRRHDELAKDYYEFKRKVIMILAFSAGGGGLLGAGILRLIGG